jgi:hypothetical protein
MDYCTIDPMETQTVYPPLSGHELDIPKALYIVKTVLLNLK